MSLDKLVKAFIAEQRQVNAMESMPEYNGNPILQKKYIRLCVLERLINQKNEGGQNSEYEEQNIM